MKEAKNGTIGGIFIKQQNKLHTNQKVPVIF